MDGREMVTYRELPGFGTGRTGFRADVGYTYFDNLTVNHARGSVDATLDNGYRYRYGYTIPENGSLVGVWDVKPEAVSTDHSDTWFGNLQGCRERPSYKKHDLLRPVSEL